MRLLNGLALCISTFAVCFVIGGCVANFLNAKDSKSLEPEPTPEGVILDIKPI
jgi:hypothetical protein